MPESVDRFRCRTVEKEVRKNQLQNLTHLLLDVPHLSLCGTPSLAVLLLDLCPDLGMWSNCWNFAEFLRVPHPSGGVRWHHHQGQQCLR